MEAPVIVGGEFIGTINFARSSNDMPFGINEMRTAGQAAEQLGLAVQRALRFERSGERASLLETVLDRLPQAIVVTDLDGRVIYANQAAEPWLDTAAPGIADALTGFRAGARRVTVGSHDAVTMKSVRLPAAVLPELGGATLTLIYPRSDTELPLWDILSPREQQITDWVAQGLTTKQISERAVVTQNTVKQHLKRIFAKADVSNRAELVQRVWATRGER
jgi:DNA-binding CsgD family transcriptional regulator